VAITAVPVFFGISAVAPEIVDLVFGSNWAAAKPILAVLSLAMSFRANLLVGSNFLQGIGQAKAGFKCGVAGAVIFPPLFVIGCYWGVLGVCYAWLLGYPIVFAVNSWIASRYGNLDLGEVLTTPLRPMIAGLIMLAVVSILRTYLPAGASELATAAILVATGAATYGAVMLVAFRPLVKEVVSLVNRETPRTT
jgi:O-antigen/teichoic acid export membrane protein